MTSLRAPASELAVLNDRVHTLLDRRPEWAPAIRTAWDLAKTVLDERRRPWGELVLAQGVEAALILDTLDLDPESLAAALLVEPHLEGGLTLEQVTDPLGPAVAHLLEGVGRMDLLGAYEGEGDDAARLEGIRKLLLAMAEDLRVVLVKLGDRLARMRGLRHLDDPLRRAVARETLDIYAPLANRLGIWQLKWELEDLSFRYLDPDRYQAIAARLDERRVDREEYIAGVVGRLADALAAEGIRANVTGRPKHIYSIWRKMQHKRVDFDDLFDVRAVRVLVDSVKDCYAALGVVHGLWPHVPREFDDYIANPKGNDYRSLHTAVVGPGGRTVEVQIRTHEMHRHAEFGVAAHWRYKEGARGDAAYAGKVAWLRQLLEVRDGGDGGDVLERFKTEVFHDRVYVLTPRGQVVDLPRGATPLDFAYAVHSEVGHRCRGAKVGGAIVPLTYELRNGDQVEVLTARQGGPSRDWLNPNLGYLRTARARGRVRQWFKQQDLDKTIAAGRDHLDRELRRLGVSDVAFDRLAQRLRFDRVEDLLAGVGRGEVGPNAIAQAVQDQVLAPAPAPEPAVRPRREEPTGGVLIQGVGNLLTHVALCCKPAPPDPIVGYITQGRGVTVHREDCANLLALAARDPSRQVDVEWSSGQVRTYPVDVQLEAFDRQGLLRDITQVLAAEKVNVVGLTTRTERDSHTAHMLVTVEVPDVDKLSRVLARLAQVHNVVDVKRKT